MRDYRDEESEIEMKVPDCRSISTRKPWDIHISEILGVLDCPHITLHYHIIENVLQQSF